MSDDTSKILHENTWTGQWTNAILLGVYSRSSIQLSTVDPLYKHRKHRNVPDLPFLAIFITARSVCGANDRLPRHLECHNKYVHAIISTLEIKLIEVQTYLQPKVQRLLQTIQLNCKHEFPVKQYKEFRDQALLNPCFPVDRNKRSEGRSQRMVVDLVPSDFSKFSSVTSMDETKDTPRWWRPFCLTVQDKTHPKQILIATGELGGPCRWPWRSTWLNMSTPRSTSMYPGTPKSWSAKRRLDRCQALAAI